MPHQVNRIFFANLGFRRNIFVRSTPLILTALLCACATPLKPQPVAPLVYPPPPEEPRFIFERTLSFSDSVEKPKFGDRLKQLATGAPKEVRGLTKPYDVAAYQDRVYVTDTVMKAVVVFDIPGERYREFGNEEPGMLIKPVGIAISALGEIFVADIGAKQILVYDLEGRYLRSIGAQSGLERPADVALDPAGLRLYVVDAGGVDSQAHVVQVFDAKTGALLQTIGKRGQNNGEFNFPLQAAVAPSGKLYVVDSGNFRVQSFNDDGSFDASFGTLGRYPGQFARPKGIATDSAGNIYVIDTAFGNVQIFNSDGQLLLFIGDRGQIGAPGKYMLPAGIDIDENGRIYIVDQFFRKVDIFRPAGLLSTPVIPSK